MTPHQEATSVPRDSAPGSARRRLLLLDHAPIMGGAERFALRLLRFAAGTGRYTPTIACPSGSELAARAADAGIEVVDLNFPRLEPWWIHRQLPAIARVRRLLTEARGGALVVANTARSQAYTVAATTLIRRPPAVVYVEHEQLTAQRLMARLALRRRGALVVVGANAAAAYRRSMPSTRIEQINNFLPADELAGLGDGLPPPREGLVIGVIARMIPEKGLVELVEELAVNRNAWSEVRLAAPAEDPRYEQEVFARVRSLELDSRIQVLGRVDDVGALLHSVDLVVVPSTGLEGQPSVILEALAAGRAVVVRAPLYSSDYEQLPVFQYTGSDDLGPAIESASRATVVSGEALLARFGPEQALLGIERAAERPTHEVASAAHV